MDHPRATLFLRMDCKNVTDYFKRVTKELTPMTPRELFDFITDAAIKSVRMLAAYIC